MGAARRIGSAARSAGGRVFTPGMASPLPSPLGLETSRKALRSVLHGGAVEGVLLV
jgi:hypothetical protein